MKNSVNLVNSHEDPMSSFYVKFLADRETNEESDKRREKHNLLGGGIIRTTIVR